MKKINLILSAVAALALFVSCSNETPKEWTNVKSHNYRYVYTVTGSMTTTNTTGTESAKNVDKTVQTIKQARADVTWGEDALNGSNYNKYNATIKGTAAYVNTITPASGTASSTKKDDAFGNLVHHEDWQEYEIDEGWYDTRVIDRNDHTTWSPESSDPDDVLYKDPSDPSYDTVNGPYIRWFEEFSIWEDEGYDSIDPISLGIYEISGDYYIYFDNEYVKLAEDALDGFFGDDEFSINYSTFKDNYNSYLSEDGKKNVSKIVNTTETAYSFTFKKVDAE